MNRQAPEMFSQARAGLAVALWWFPKLGRQNARAWGHGSQKHSRKGTPLPLDCQKQAPQKPGVILQWQLSRGQASGSREPSRNPWLQGLSTNGPLI